MQPENLNLDSWEQLWAPYNEQTYQAVLAAIRPDDTLLDIGAGDLRLASRAAAIAYQVYAIEIQASILALAPKGLPDNLVVIPGDARSLHFPPGVTNAILLMRHCTHFDLYVKKLQAVGCGKLITNARWRSGIEVINLWADRQPYSELELGWYACLCGSVGFKTGPVEKITDDTAHSIVEVFDCTGCHFPGREKQHQKECDPYFENIPAILTGSEGPITLFQEGARAK